MKLSIRDARDSLQKLDYFSTVWEDNATDKHIHQSFDVVSRIEHLEYVSGITELRKSLGKVDALLRFYDLKDKPKDKEFSPEFIENVKENLKYLRSKKQFILDEIESISSKVYIEIED